MTHGSCVGFGRFEATFFWYRLGAYGNNPDAIQKMFTTRNIVTPAQPEKVEEQVKVWKPEAGLENRVPQLTEEILRRHTEG